MNYSAEKRYQHLTHEAFGPLYNEESRVLILGSFPSVKSREAAFYYGHPQNRFWPLLADLFREQMPENTEAKKAFILSNHLALWDVIDSCDIIGSSDASIRKIFLNGSTAYRLFLKHPEKELLNMAEKLPSTSPANAAWSLEKLKTEWNKVPYEVHRWEAADGERTE